MKEHPILFSTDMVKAILDGRKTQTRRVIKPQPYFEDTIGCFNWVRGEYWHKNHAMAQFADSIEATKYMYKMCPYGQVGVRLWVREAHKLTKETINGELWVKAEYRFEYDGDKTVRRFKWDDIPKTQRQRLSKIKTWGKWRPARFMYEFLARVWLEITGVRVERLQEISEEDAKAEGFPINIDYPELNVGDFSRLWDSINAKRGYSWESNPWVWVIEFVALQSVGLSG